MSVRNFHERIIHETPASGRPPGAPRRPGRPRLRPPLQPLRSSAPVLRAPLSEASARPVERLLALARERVEQLRTGNELCEVICVQLGYAQTVTLFVSKL